MNNLRSTNLRQLNAASLHPQRVRCFKMQRPFLNWTAAALAMISLSVGCSNPDVSTESQLDATDSAHAASCLVETQTVATVALEPSDQSPASATDQENSEASGLLGRAGELLSGAKQVTGQQAADTGQWLKGAWDGATDSTSGAVDGSLDWANETFKSLKEQGLTTASSTGQWLSEDWQKMESFQYKVLPTDSVPADELENKLNELGSLGWECFSIDDERMVFKKASDSYLKRLPFKDVLRLAPLLNQGK